MKLKTILIGIIIFVVATGLSYLAFANFILKQSLITPAIPAPKQGTSQLEFDPNLPKTQPCPLNGELFSKQQEAWWKTHRPLAVMIENSLDARPQSGIGSADVVYEALAEGGITRFMGVFYCQDAGEVGPVRSARTYFLDMISEYGSYPLYTHVGGANTPGPADALGQIDTYGWTGYNDLNQFSIGFPTFWRDYERLGHTVATEHTMYSEVDKLWAVGKTRGLTNVDKNGNSWNVNFTPYTFKDDAATNARSSSQTVDVPYDGDMNNDYSVEWDYDNTTNTYLRVNGGQKQLDYDTKKQLAAKNVVVLFMTVNPANDGYPDNEHLLYGTVGTGQAEVFMDGKEIDGTWSKASRTDHLYLKNSNGSQIALDRGLIWFELVPDTMEVTAK